LADELQQVEFIRTNNIVQRLSRILFRVPVFYDVPGSLPNEADFAWLEPMYEKVHICHEFLVVRDEEIRQFHVGRSCLDIDGRAVVHHIVSTVSSKEDGLLDASSRFLDCDFTDDTREVGINRSSIPVYLPAFDGFVGELPGLSD